MGPPDGYEAPAPVTLHVEAERPADAVFAILVSATMRVVCSTVYALLFRLSLSICTAFSAHLPDSPAMEGNRINGLMSCVLRTWILMADERVP